jgi:hypothetical protein
VVGGAGVQGLTLARQALNHLSRSASLSHEQVSDDYRTAIIKMLQQIIMSSLETNKK